MSHRPHLLFRIRPSAIWILAAAELVPFSFPPLRCIIQRWRRGRWETVR